MIEIKKRSEPEWLAALGAQEGEDIFAAFEGGEMVGFCRYRLDGQTVVLVELNQPDGDMMLADGMARAAIASCRGRALRVKCQRTELLQAFMTLSGCYDNNGEAEIEAALTGRRCEK